MNQLLRLTYVIALSTVVGAVTSVAQTITVSPYTANPGGASINASYDLGPNWTTECCDPKDIRWIQKITLTDDKGKPKTVPGFPVSDFIDPQPGKTIGTYTSDNDPWYDFTYDSKAKWMADPIGNAKQGAGSFMVDFPGGWNQVGIQPINFAAQTLIVCKKSDPTANAKGQFCFLGGFSWGFTVDDKGNTNLMPLAQLSLTDGLADGFNASLSNALSKPFDKWEMLKKPCCDDTFKLVPEPSTMLLLAGLPLLAARRRRRQAK